MCTNPQTLDGRTFKCRRCNACIVARKNDWIARAMAEKATSHQVVCLTLTYRDRPDGTAPDGARAFAYMHCQQFLKRLRASHHRRHQAHGQLRYIVCGERGSQKNRVHWHMVLFSDRPILDLGTWTDFGGKALDGPRIGQRKKLDHWSLWPHGTVDVIEPDQRGMAYVLKYAIKDAFNAVQSRGTAREADAETHGASYFRMSKQPPIGMRYLDQRLAKWAKALECPTRLELKIPGYSGFYWPLGMMRKHLIAGIHEINRQSNLVKGRDCPQWVSLLSSVEVSLEDWEGLVYGEVETAEEFHRDREEERIGTERSSIRRRCGGVRTCQGCEASRTREGREAYRAWYSDQAREYVTDTASPGGSFDTWFRRQGRINPFCVLADLDDRSDAFGGEPGSAQGSPDLQGQARQSRGEERHRR